MHERDHTGEKTFNYPHCDKKFIQKDNLRADMEDTNQEEKVLTLWAIEYLLIMIA